MENGRGHRFKLDGVRQISVVKKKVEGDDPDFGVSDLPGVGEVTLKKLQSGGIRTIFDLCMRGSMEITELTGVPQSEAEEMVKIAWDRLSEEKKLCRPRIMDVTEYYNFRKALTHIPTQCSNIDSLLLGGVELEALTEVYGEFGSGKTQLCNVLTVEAIQQLGYNVLWIDCEDTFRPERLLEIAQARGYISTEQEGVDKYFNKITYMHVPNTDILVNTVDNISSLMLDKDIKLVVVDGSIGQFRAEYLGRSTLSVRQNNLSRFMEHLKNVSFFFRCAVLMTNQVQADPSVSMFHMDPVKPIGGNVVGHVSTYRIYLRKAGSKRFFRMVDSPQHAMEEKEFVLTKAGVEDPKKK